MKKDSPFLSKVGGPPAFRPHGRSTGGCLGGEGVCDEVVSVVEPSVQIAMELVFWNGEVLEVLRGYVPVYFIPVWDFVGGNVKG